MSSADASVSSSDSNPITALDWRLSGLYEPEFHTLANHVYRIFYSDGLFLFFR